LPKLKVKGIPGESKATGDLEILAITAILAIANLKTRLAVTKA
jgi:hypothetical protein